MLLYSLGSVSSAGEAVEIRRHSVWDNPLVLFGTEYSRILFLILPPLKRLSSRTPATKRENPEILCLIMDLTRDPTSTFTLRKWHRLVSTRHLSDNRSLAISVRLGLGCKIKHILLHKALWMRTL